MFFINHKLLSVCLIFFTLKVFSQNNKDTLHYEKGYSVVVNSKSTNDMERFLVEAGWLRSYQPHFLRLSYLVPSKHIFTLKGLGGYGFEGTSFFSKKVKPYTAYQTFDGDHLYYLKGELPMQKEIFYGLRYGSGWFWNNTDHLVNEIQGRVMHMRMPIHIGLSRVKMLYGNYSIYKFGRKLSNSSGRRVGMWKLDFIFYPVSKFDVREPYIVVPDDEIDYSEPREITESTFNFLKGNALKENFSIKFSTRGVLGAWGSSGFALTYDLGMIYTPNSAKKNFFTPKYFFSFGVGVAYNFDVPFLIKERQ